MLNQFLTNIVILRNNLYTLHFNIVGEGSSDYHNKIGEYINVINNIYDKIAENIKQHGGFIIMDYNKIKDISNIKLLTNKNYTVNELKKISNIFAIYETVKDIILMMKNL